MIDPRDLTRQVAGEEARSARNVERPCRGERLDRRDQGAVLLRVLLDVPAPPVVVLAGPGLVVRLHGCQEGPAKRCLGSTDAPSGNSIVDPPTKGLLVSIWLWILIIILVLALLGFFGRGRFSR